MKKKLLYLATAGIIALGSTGLFAKDYSPRRNQRPKPSYSTEQVERTEGTMSSSQSGELGAQGNHNHLYDTSSKIVASEVVTLPYHNFNLIVRTNLTTTYVVGDPVMINSFGDDDDGNNLEYSYYVIPVSLFVIILLILAVVFLALVLECKFGSTAKQSIYHAWSGR